MNEMVIALKVLKDGKAPGGDIIPAEVWTHGVANLYYILHRWITIINLVECKHSDDYLQKRETEQNVVITGGISLLSAAGKIVARIQLNRHSTQITPEVVPDT